MYGCLWWFKFLCKYGTNDIAFTNKTLTQFRLHGDSKSVGDGYIKFHYELLNVWYKIALQTKLEDFLKISLKNDLKINYYKTDDWNLNKLNKNIFESELCIKYMYTYYKNFRYKEAKFCIKKVIKFNRKKINVKFVILVIKVMFIPCFLLKLLRSNDN